MAGANHPDTNNEDDGYLTALEVAEIDWEGTEEEKNRSLAPLDKVSEEFSEIELPEIDGIKPIQQKTIEKTTLSDSENLFPPRSGEVESIREGHKEESGRRAARKQDERDF